MHLKDETLRAFADGQLDPAADVADHLNSCAGCQARLAEIAARTARVNARLAALDPRPAEAPRPQLAFTELGKRTSSPVMPKEPLQMFKNMFSPRYRAAWIALSTIVLLAVAFSFPGVQAFAGDLLARFRVQRVAVVEVTNNRLTELGGNTALAKQIGQMVSDSVQVTKEPGKPQKVASAAEASKLAGFTVRLPGSRSDTPALTVQDAAAFEFVVNRARAQTLLNEIGGNFTLPASIDRANIKVSIPAGVSAAYGDCPPAGQEESAQRGSTGRRYVNCIMLVEIPSPTVDTPPEMDVRQLAELGLQIGGMSPDQARAFSQKVDWTSTLVIPVPRNGASYKELTVDGVSGYVIQRPSDDAPQYVIVWVKDGIIHAVGGLGSDTSAAQAIANSLK